MRAWLVGLIVLATVGFVIATSIERHNSSHESAAQLRAEGDASQPAATGERSENAATHAAETHAAAKADSHKELRPLGVDIEAVPFVVLASLASLVLVAAGWARPSWLLGLALIAAAMLVFGALDVREAFHQSDEKQTGLVILAAVIAVLHLAAAAVAAAMAWRGAPGAATAAGAADTLQA